MAILKDFLHRLGLVIHMTTGPLTDEEWDKLKVHPLYEEWLKHPHTEDDFVDPKLLEAFDRGEITREELLARMDH